MSVVSLTKIFENSSSLDPILKKIEQATKLSSLVLAALCLAHALAVMIIESELGRRAKEPTQWPACPACGARIESKGFESRSLMTLVGLVGWKRRVGRCTKKGCNSRQVVPFDDVLGIEPYQQTSNELKRVSCALAVFVTFEVAEKLLAMISAIMVSPGSIRNWVQEAGSKAMERVQEQLLKLEQGEELCEDSLDEALALLPLIMGADGVKAPFRPNGGSPEGKTVYREVNIGIFARLAKRINRKGEEVTCLKNRRLVAVLGCNQMLGARMLIEAVRQGMLTAKTVVWISDGGPGLWTVYRQRFARYATAILDFYHAAQNIWKAAEACLGGSTDEARKWFGEARHMLRHGKPDDLLKDIKEAMKIKDLSDAERHALSNLYEYLDKHRGHIDYSRFKKLGLPLGSGMVESACKWLIQQRFKGTGMRWSEEGFNHLLHLRLAWVNSSFDDLWPGAVWSPEPLTTPWAQCENCEFKQFMSRNYKPKNDPLFDKNRFIEWDDE